MPFQTEDDAIREVILAYYHEGHVRNDPEPFREILHPECRFFVLDGDGRLLTFSREEYLARYDPAQADPGLHWETEFLSVDVTGSIGAVKLRLECERLRFIDYFQMMKINGKWWIVHKMSDYRHKV